MNDFTPVDFEDAFVGTWHWNIPDNTVSVSPALASQLGYASDELTQTPDVWNALFLPEYAAEISSQHYALSEALQPLSYREDVRCRHKSGAIVWVTHTAQITARDAQGRPTQLAGRHVDITRYKEAQLENQMYRSILAGNQVGVWEADLVNGRMVFDEQWAAQLGYTSEELRPFTRDNWLALVHPDDAPYAQQALAAHLAGTQSRYECEVRMQHKNGQWVWMLDKGTLTQWSASGTPLQMQGCRHTVTERKQYQAQIEHYRELLQKVNQVAQIGTWEVDLAKNEPVWSQVTKEIHEVDENFQPDLSTALAFYPAGVHRETITRAVHQAIQEGQGYDLELQILTARNKLKWVRAIGIPEFDQNQCTRLYGIFQDIDAQKTTELKIRDSLRRNQIFVEQCPGAIAMFDTQMRYLAASQQWIEEYALQGRQIIGVSHYTIFPEIGDDWKQIHQECLQGHINQRDEVCFPRMNDTTQWINWDVRPWYISEEEIGGLVMYTSDVTERKEAAIRLARSEEQFRQTFDHAAIGMALVSTKGAWLRVNRQVCELLGYTEKELMQKTFQDVTHPDDLEIDLLYVQQLLNRQINTYRMEKRYFHKSGSTVWVNLAVSLVRDERGRPLHFVSQIEDITERKIAFQKLEETLVLVKEQNDRLMNFAHIVSHNLRSHGGNLEMMLTFFSTETDEDEKALLLQNINNISASLSETITHLTQVVQIQTRAHEQKEELGLRRFLDKTISTLSADLRRTEGVVTNEVPDEARVLFNAAYLDSVLLNFLSNALKYRHPQRTPQITLSMDEQERYRVLSIRDNGMGIDLERHGAKLFGLYKTFHEHADARGVGLFITKNQIEAMGGKVAVESTPGVGTTFKIYFCYEKDTACLHH
ncbi:PAS domain S-box-containing protein [Catalinimonas alkaloidigena]|uniref:histidine kinase n=1 Tax=Catalinimonas alkaloidigena TaxID=1075417 RepID=A0A1G9DFV0_9BACT|nr:PAS domain-containing sensor histidine kinase [Catalinimonas alkaloidigena]SDK62761.1 PAS domain S-box-containing protein [Catalinimonas alkaloidigena]